MHTKSDIRISLLNDQGVLVEDRLEAAHKRQAGHDGAQQALRQVAKQLAGLAVLVDRDTTSNALPVDDVAAVASYIKQLITRAVETTLAAAHHHEKLQLTVGGEILAYESVVASIYRSVVAERLDAQNAAAVTSAVTTPVDAPPSTRPHPGDSVAALRKAAEAVEADAAGVEAPPTVTTPLTVTKSRRRRP